MKNNQVLAVFFVAIVCRATVDIANAQGRDGFRTALETCAKQVGLTPPSAELGTPQVPPTEEQRNKIDQCLKAEGFSPPRLLPRHAPMDAEKYLKLKECFQQDGIEFPARGQEPSEPQRAQFEKCRLQVSTSASEIGS